MCYVSELKLFSMNARYTYFTSGKCVATAWQLCGNCVAIVWQSLGTVIFGGLVVATVLSLGVVPPFYVVIKGLEARWFGQNQQDESDDAAIAGAS